MPADAEHMNLAAVVIHRLSHRLVVNGNRLAAVSRPAPPPQRGIDLPGVRVDQRIADAVRARALDPAAAQAGLEILSRHPVGLRLDPFG